MGSIVERHISRLATPKTWEIKKKGIKWVTRPNPGAHPFVSGMPLSVFLRDVVKMTRTTREAKKMLHDHEIIIDGKRRKDNKFIVGLMDVVSFPETGKNFRVLFDKRGKISAVPLDDKEAKIKLGKIRGKKMMKKGMIQLNLWDSRNILVKEDNYDVGDTVKIEIPSQEIKESFKLEKGACVYLTGGAHIGETGIVEDIKEDKLIYKKDDELLETLKEYAFVVGKKTPAITIEKEE